MVQELILKLFVQHLILTPKTLQDGLQLDNLVFLLPDGLFQVNDSAKGGRRKEVY